MKDYSIEYLYGVKSLRHLKDLTVEKYFREKIRLGNEALKSVVSKNDSSSSDVVRIKAISRAIEYNMKRLEELGIEI